MKFILFRPTFVTASMLFQLVAFLCVCLTSVSAAPQFGRPLYFGALDEIPSDTGNVHVPGEVAGAPATVSAVSSAPVVDAAPTPAVASDPVNEDAVSTASLSPTPSPVPNQSSGASHHLGGVHTALVLSAAASAVYFAF